MPKTTGATVYRYTGEKRPRVAPFAGVPARDLTADDVARLELSTIKAMTGGAKPVYVAVGDKATQKPAVDAATDAPAAKAAKE